MGKPSKGEPGRTWWVVYAQDIRRTQRRARGSGSRYALQTFFGTSKQVEQQFRSSLQFMTLKRAEAIQVLKDINIIDEVMES